MWGCVWNVQYSIIVNGTPRGSIQTTRGFLVNPSSDASLELFVFDIVWKIKILRKLGPLQVLLGHVNTCDRLI